MNIEHKVFLAQVFAFGLGWLGHMIYQASDKAQKKWEMKNEKKFYDWEWED
jgi:hypothetical protein